METIDYTDASTLGWLPGEWPPLFSWQGHTFKRGERIAEYGELIGYRYLADTGSILFVGND